MPTLSDLQDALSETNYRNAIQRLVRCSFLIQLVEPMRVNTTLYTTRWGSGLAASDPRRQTPDGCLAIFERAVDLTLKALARREPRENLLDVLDLRLPAYEIPIDYKTRNSVPIHSSDNITWVTPRVMTPVTLQRKVLLKEMSREYAAFFKAVYKKVSVKTYLTDRVLTGGHKTNREYRWEVHPKSVHFALRRDCLAIEEKLVRAICAIGDLPADLAATLEAAGLRDVGGGPTRCPITLDPMEYEILRDELLSPVQGISSYQVGHMNPLKALNTDPYVGHTAANVAWVSQDGNRIQGKLTLDETRAMLAKIAENYETLGLVN